LECIQPDPSKNSFITKNQNKFVVKLNDTASLSGLIHNNLWELLLSFEMNLVSLYLLSFVKVDWHARLGHPSTAYLQKMVPLAESNNDCETCKMCKLTKLPFKGKFSSFSENLEALHLDLVGPFQTRSVSDCWYFLTIVDQFSG
jgi:hypothetical protein